MAGEVVHYEISATDVDRAKSFWEGVFGWQFGPSMSEDFDYRVARVTETAGAALTSGEPGHPNFYFDTPDIDASMAKVQELGGEAGDKQPVPGHGWFSPCKDSEGNAFSLWQGDESVGS